MYRIWTLPNRTIVYLDPARIRFAASACANRQVPEEPFIKQVLKKRASIDTVQDLILI